MVVRSWFSSDCISYRVDKEEARAKQGKQHREEADATAIAEAAARPLPRSQEAYRKLKCLHVTVQKGHIHIDIRIRVARNIGVGWCILGAEVVQR